MNEELKMLILLAACRGKFWIQEMGERGYSFHDIKPLQEAIWVSDMFSQATGVPEIWPNGLLAIVEIRHNHMDLFEKCNKDRFIEKLVRYHFEVRSFEELDQVMLDIVSGAGQGKSSKLFSAMRDLGYVTSNWYDYKPGEYSVSERGSELVRRILDGRVKQISDATAPASHVQEPSARRRL